MTRQRLRAVVLAAGHGTRLRPLTAELPKPLLPVLGRPLLAETLERLAAAGVEAAAINLHHRAEAIPDSLGDRFAGMPLHYSREEPILGTLGALHPLRDFLAPADLVLMVNGDSLCRWPLAELIERHRETKPYATLLLSMTADAGAFGGVAIDATGRIVGFPGGPDHGPVAARRVWCGAQVFAPSLARDAPAAFSDSVRDLYRPGLAAGLHLESLSTAAAWHDLGSPGRYLDAVLDWAARASGAPGADDAAAPTAAAAKAAAATATSSWRGTWVGGSARVDGSAELERAVIEAGAVLEPGVHGRDLLVLGGARVGRSSRLERVVVGPGVEIADGSSIADTLVTPRAWGTVAGSRQEGPLVFTPLAAVGAGTAP